MLYAIGAVACINLTVGNPPQEIWVTFLSISLGGVGVSILQKILPSPRKMFNKSPNPSINLGSL